MPCTGFRQDLPNVGSLLALGALRGEWRLDDPVSKYIIELHGGYISRVTIGQLATRTSGLLLPTDRPPWPNAPYSLAEFIDMPNAWMPHAGDEFGKQRIYSRAGYVPASASPRTPLRSSDRTACRKPRSDAARHAFDADPGTG